MTPKGLDPRGPRFGAGITAILMLVVIYLSLDVTSEANVQTSVLVMSFAVAMFIIGSALGPAKHPYSFVYKFTLRKALGEPTELEDPRPVRFAQFVGLMVTGIGLTLHFVGVPLALPVSAAMAFLAAFLNAAFAYCLGCQMYLGLKRIGIIR
jgi:hypothetical protein